MPKHKPKEGVAIRQTIPGSEPDKDKIADLKAREESRGGKQ